MPAADRHGAQRRQGDLPQEAPIQGVALELVMGIVQVERHELVVHQPTASQHIRALRDDLLPARPALCRVGRVQGHQPAARRIQVGVQVKHRAVVVDES